eukprot:TRINITY_DN55622_c0_g1_i1.p1 TRINITY_DN55622_c0_g1~~TRINITY_DN55622_c0_g1_i1.p1  ORF type:complete len:1666 (+),score=660.69 TRINITY_DN55622_c0_g1_i1:105-5000(+)
MRRPAAPAAAALLALLLPAAEAKNVKTSLLATWPETSLAGEAAEFMAGLPDSTLFWSFAEALGGLAADGFDDRLASPAEVSAVVNQVAQRLLSPSLRAALNLALATRYYSPRLETYRAFQNGSAGESPSPYVDIAGQRADSPQRLAAALGAVPAAGACGEGPALFDFDHVHPSSAEGACPAVLYTTLTHEGFLPLHRALLAAAREGKVRYVLRFLPSPSTGPRVGLQGYGVSLMIKNMEYKAMDDTKKEGDGAKEAAAAEEETEGAEGGSFVMGLDFDRLKSRRPELTEELTGLEDSLRKEAGGAATHSGDVDLKVWQIQDLGSQAAYRILKSSDRLATMGDIAQNFPRHASQLSHINNKGVRRVQKALGKQARTLPVQQGSSVLYVNGKSQKLEDLSPFSLLELVSAEFLLKEQISQVLTLGAPKGAAVAAEVGETATALLALPMAAQQEQQTRRGGRAQRPSRRFVVDKELIDWVNDIETDGMYDQWDRDLGQILQTNFFGMPSFARRNLYNAIFVVDAGSREGLLPAAHAVSILNQMIPIRLGFVFTEPDLVGDDQEVSVAESDLLPAYLEAAQAVDADGPVPAAEEAGEVNVTLARAVFCSYRWLEQNAEEPLASLQFLNVLGRGTTALTLEEIEETFASIKTGDVQWSAMVRDPACAARLKANTRAVAKRGLLSPPVLTMMNGLIMLDDPGNALQKGFYAEQTTMRGLVQSRKLTNKVKDCLDFALKHGKAQGRYQPAVFEKEEFAPLASPEAFALLERTVWAYPPTYSGTASEQSGLLLVDVESRGGRAHAVNALLSLVQEQETNATRLALVLRHSGEPGRVTVAVAALLSQLGSTPEGQRARLLARVVHAMGGEKDLAAALATLKTLGEKLDASAVQKAAEGQGSKAVRQLLETHRSFLRRHEVSGSAGTVLLLNGRVVRLDASDRQAPKGSPAFSSSDFALLVGHERYERAGELHRQVSAIDWGELVTGLDGGVSPDYVADRTMLLSSLLGHEYFANGERSSQLKPVTAKNCPTPCRTAFAVEARDDLGIDSGVTLDIIAVIDPLSKEAQRVTPILQSIHSVLPCRISVYLNPPASMQEVPLKTYYRYVMAPTLRFNEQGEVIAPSAFFTQLPESRVLTMGVDEPEAWIVTSHYAPYDLDNIKLEDVEPQTLVAEYELMSILVTGGCVDVTTGQPPRGLPLEMRRHGEEQSDSRMRDTLVMSNYGYFQLKAAPGTWTINIKDGRGSEIYSILDALLIDQQNYNTKPKPVADIAVDNFNGRYVHLKVTRNPGQEKANLLIEAKDGKATDEEEEGAGMDGDEEGMLSSIGSLWGEEKKEKKRKAAEPEKIPLGPDGRPVKPTLNIFSVASGHLYERFLKIMAHTTMLHSNGTDRRIKFWFLNNFLSPEFKQVIPHMAKEWGFEYELVTYKWPYWLRRQTEKQRIIWGYKVLFLDVLFPLGVDKVIYVDADQIVRADLHELYNLDLEGNAVAYTPFCIENENKETTGFRFWDSGYWKSHLRGKPYHISAIYVVDLKKFRRIAAGDHYRVIYDNLSQDPNSLSNLDQDLPNYVQHMVGIFSLPEHWLWCETWCNQESKAAAKTIDLCNNPLTKTPKLENAKRIVPEWTSYDEHIANFERGLALRAQQ